MLIWKFGSQPQRAGRRIDLIINTDQLTLVGYCRAVVSEYIDFDSTLGCCSIHPRNLLLRKAELNGDRLKLRNDDESGRIRGIDDVAAIDLAQTDATGNRRDDLGK